MSERSFKEGMWKRGWDDAVSIWRSWPFIILDAVVVLVVSAISSWYWGLTLIISALFFTWLWATAAAPIKQRNEARAKVDALEKERQPSIGVHPLPYKRAPYERDNKTACAGLEVKNTSSEVDLNSVSVQILEVMQVFEIQDEKGVGTGTYGLFDRYPKWIPANVYWDSSSAIGNQFEIPIPRGATKVALTAFHRQNGPALGFLNTPTYPPMQESRIVIEISSPNMNTWQGTYYIEYLPSRQDKFDFVEWYSWCTNHHVIERQDSQTLPKE